ncbi:putative Histidine kinase [Nostocoides japonicum T1-X7]|uniref:histidine kinase n=1 Tax=Nostocoides japonicum T1-X7 TaxID=1194083 RepID=A0A077LUJ5_9MICO|nr:histidine kinase [Tetrasphaera japonica]CCH76332.1 putative Histidine kinase [Tetrasphaera japonica T1-X7]
MALLRRHLLDAGLLLLAVAALATSVGQGSSADRIGSVLAAVALVVLLARRRQPLGSAVVAFAIIMVGSQTAPRASGLEFFAILAVFGTVGTLRSRRDAVVAWVLGCATFGTAMARNPSVGGAGDIALTLTFCTVIWGAGLFGAERGRAAALAHARADAVEATRDAEVRDAADHERSRIAAELHDIVSHGLSIVVLQSVAARMALRDGEPEEAVDRRLDAVETTARDALADMRRMLGLIQVGPDSQPVSSPAAGLAELPALVAQLRAAGAHIELETDDDLVVPAGLDATAYRIVQESLTNVVKHAPGAPATVRVHHEGDRLRLSVCNALAGRSADALAGRSADALPGAGRGLIGMRERVDLYDGTLEVGAEGDEFRVVATFPLPASDRRRRGLLRRGAVRPA